MSQDSPAGDPVRAGDPVQAQDLVQVSGLSVRYGSGRFAARAVDGVDLTLRRGEIVALAGESGCGKTSLARALLGLQRPAAGSVSLDGVPLRHDRASLKAWRRRVQLVPQDPTGSLNPRRTVYDAVSEGLRVHRIAQGADRAQERVLVAQALSRAGLRPAERFFDRYPHELSGGQRQRVLIAGALVVEPDVLIADEPVSSLDASVRGTILALLLQLRDELGLTVLVVTHDLGLAWNIADRLAVMYLGRIVEAGPTEQILMRPRHPYTQALLSVVPEIEHRVPIVLTGEPPDPTHVPGGCRFHPRCPLARSGRLPEATAHQCTHDDLPVLPAAASAPRAAACWAIDQETLDQAVGEQQVVEQQEGER
jgi:peptide/nickel transport system ATP-binding protein